ncbi:MAG TPA: hypothetical protein VHO49_15495 [Anaerolineales bacterium]|nr:hypothetical protein [Anaerolineales bacterium]
MRVSTVLNRRIDPRLVIGLTAGLAVLFYLLVSDIIFRIGFPLDDAWIHFTYARNFAEHGQWAFRLGETSAASTAPLWTVLLGLGYVFKLAPYIWTFLLGWVILALLGIQAEATARKLAPYYKPRLPWVGLFFVTAWHLTWSAVSGMETLLHGYIIFIVLTRLIIEPRQYLALGFIAGLSIWVRPDGLTLLGPLLFTALLVEKNMRSRLDAVARILIGFGALFIPYLLFNLALSGNPMPNTFYAKQAEYQQYWLAQSLAYRINDYLLPVLASPFLVLLPGAGLWLREMIQDRNWGAIAGLIWVGGYIAIYFMRLPAYQHGRYIIPAFPVMYLWGMLGMIKFVTSPKANTRLVVVWQLLLGVLSVLFSITAARQNAFDVYWIESEMVESAKWVQQNIPPDALLAVHDIGALGYYVPNRMIDLAGLITPDVIPFIRDTDQLREYLDSKSADYLIVFEGQYPGLTSGKPSLFTSGLSTNLIDFDDHIQVFEWK